MANKKGFKNAGADLFFSASDAPEQIAKTKNTRFNNSDKYANILSNIKTQDKTPGANCTFYLDKKTIDALMYTAKEMGISRSKLVNRILLQVLAEE